MTLYLHIGLPKTGTTAIQDWCYSNRDLLKQSGFDYAADHVPPFDPKHHFLTGEFFSGDFIRTAEALNNADRDRVILSNEGLSLCFLDFEPQHVDRFRAMLQDRDLTIVIALRQAEDWLKSLYRQCLVNPVDSSTISAIGRSLDEFSQLPRLRQLLDHDMLLDSLFSTFRPKRIETMDYGENILADFLCSIGAVSDASLQADAKNDSLPGFLVPLVVKVNASRFSQDRRFAWLALIMESFSIENINLSYYRTQLENPDHLRAIEREIEAGFLADIDGRVRSRIGRQLGQYRRM